MHQWVCSRYVSEQGLDQGLIPRMFSMQSPASLPQPLVACMGWSLLGAQLGDPYLCPHSHLHIIPSPFPNSTLPHLHSTPSSSHSHPQPHCIPIPILIPIPSSTPSPTPSYPIPSPIPHPIFIPLHPHPIPHPTSTPSPSPSPTLSPSPAEDMWFYLNHFIEKISPCNHTGRRHGGTQPCSPAPFPDK